MQDNNTITFAAHEADMTRMERTNRRVWILCIILIVALLGTNVGWLWYESQFQYYETEITQDTGEGGYNNYIGNDGDINNGTTDSSN